MALELYIHSIAAPRTPAPNPQLAIDHWTDSINRASPIELEEILECIGDPDPGRSPAERIIDILTAALHAAILELTEDTNPEVVSRATYGDIKVWTSAGLTSGDPVSALARLLDTIDVAPDLFSPALTAAGFILNADAEGRYR